MSSEPTKEEKFTASICFVVFVSGMLFFGYVLYSIVFSSFDCQALVIVSDVNNEFLREMNDTIDTRRHVLLVNDFVERISIYRFQSHRDVTRSRKLLDVKELYENMMRISLKGKDYLDVLIDMEIPMLFIEGRLRNNTHSLLRTKLLLMKN